MMMRAPARNQVGGWIGRRLVRCVHAWLAAGQLGRLVGVIVLVAGSAGAIAQEYPDRPIRLIAPFAAGGPVDLFARIFASAAAPRLGQPVVVENRAGAGGVIGVEAAAKSARDGYTLVFSGPGALVAAPFLTARFPIDVLADLTPITMVARMPTVIVVAPQAGIKTLRELIDHARANPGKISYASAGSGTLTHLAGELLKIETGVDMVHVPYKGAAPALADLVAGRVQMMLPDLPPALVHVRAGNAIALAVASSSRAPSAPEVPTTAEAGFGNHVSESIYGLLAPAGIPAAVLRKLNALSVSALADPATAEQIRRQGAQPVSSTPEEYRDWIAAEQRKWSAVIRKTGIKLD